MIFTFQLFSLFICLIKKLNISLLPKFFCTGGTSSTSLKYFFLSKLFIFLKHFLIESLIGKALLQFLILFVVSLNDLSELSVAISIIYFLGRTTLILYSENLPSLSLISLIDLKKYFPKNKSLKFSKYSL